MKKHAVLLGFGLPLLALSTQAQEVASVVANTRKPKTYESAVTYRLGRQGVSLGSLNQALEQTGYRALPSQFTVFGVASEASSGRSAWKMITQFDIAFNTTNLATTNGTNTARTSFFQYGIGAGYRIVHTDKFTLTPKLILSPAFFHLKVTRNDTPTPSVASVLTNPGSQQTASLNSSTIVGDLGLSGQYRFVYGSKTTSTDCGPVVTERSLLLGFDAGYRLSPRTGFNQSTSDVGANPTVNLSGWYLAARLGFGRRYTR